MDMLGLAGDRKRQRINLEGKSLVERSEMWLSVIEGGESLMENNCIQYRVTGGSGGSAGESSPSSNGGMAYRVVNTTEGETTTTTRPSISSSNSALSNVQVKQELKDGLTD